MLLGAFLLGVWLGWILWNRYKQEVDRLRIANQSLQATADTLRIELEAARTRTTTLETDSSNLAAQVIHLNRSNGNLQDRLNELEMENTALQNRNRQVETELGLSFVPDEPAAVLVEISAPEDPEWPETEPEAAAPAATIVQLDPEFTSPETEAIDPEPFQPEILDAMPEPEFQPVIVTPLAVSEPAPSAFPIASLGNETEDLTIVEGIGPKIAMLLNQYGIQTYRQLAGTDVIRLKEILQSAGPQLAMHNPGTWPSQANLAANGEWDTLKSLQDFLKGGKAPK